jgi:putative transposase
MARLARLFAPHCAQHVLQRCAPGRGLAHDEADFTRLVECLAESAQTTGVAVHAYVLMPDHLHLLASPREALDLSHLMQATGRRYVPYLNRRHHLSGALWAGRFRATTLEDEPYVLLASRYIESNPVRNRLVEEPQHYRYSSYRHHVGLEVQRWITDHRLYWALGNTPFERQRRYNTLFEAPLAPAQVTALREATWHGWALGSSAFVESLEKSANRRPMPLSRGRRPVPGRPA